MTTAQACFLFVAAVLGGTLTSVASGGGFLLFPALIFIGLPSINANATSMTAGWLGCAVSVAAYRHELSGQQRISLVLGSISLVGGMIGALLLLYTPTDIFDRLIPYLLLLSTLLFTFGGKITTWLHSDLEDSRRSLLTASVIQFFLAIYGGFYGAGVAMLMLATMEMLGMKNIHKMNALKMLLMSCTSGFAVVTYVIAGVVAWQPAVFMMLGTVVGGYGGAYYARKLQPDLVKRFIIIVSFAMTYYFFIRAYYTH
ncbi:sulfite exporter TauE/SafE family protein [Brasilonema bromeliae]|uniref:sulfite exporter TauE/SafE family protein n=1 Tax=Brasilonema bromeliae TaxID=383615 RepID=UPI00145FADB9|nr:sulfite exporter TauE/SafE family protein [Brasilonema bromeliae]